MSRQVNVTIGPDGQLKFEAIGYTGGTCKTDTAFLSKIAGEGAVSEDKPELYLEEEAEVLHQEG